MKTLATVSFALCMFAAASHALTQQQAPQHTVEPSSGKGLCSALTPASLTKVGVPVTALQDANADDANAHIVSGKAPLPKWNSTSSFLRVLRSMLRRGPKGLAERNLAENSSPCP